MWLLTNFGFFSVVQKPGEEVLTVRGRCGDDLDRLRELYLPALGPTLGHAGTDYPVRARVGRAELARAMSEIVRDLHYSNFKDAVASEQGAHRSHVYHRVWEVLRQLEESPTLATHRPRSDARTRSPADRKRAFGGVVTREDGRILLRRPRGDFDGYVWTYPKGGADPGETPQQAALREVLEETGVVAEIVGELPGDHDSGQSTTRFFVMRAIRETGVLDRETSEIAWVTSDEAAVRIRATRNVAGRTRDLAVLDAYLAWKEIP